MLRLFLILLVFKSDLGTKRPGPGPTRHPGQARQRQNDTKDNHRTFPGRLVLEKTS